jgi:enoyl-[acyl-carrier protein] reductase I
MQPCLLAGKRLVITGVLTRDSIAYGVARRAEAFGAELLLTSFGRARRLTERSAASLARPADVVELDVRDPRQFEALADAVDERWGRLDGVLHSIAFAPPQALGGRFLRTPRGDVLETLEVSAVSLRDLASALVPLLSHRDGGSIVGMDFDASTAWPDYDWMGVAKGALESIRRYLARDLGPKGVRVNLVSAGPLQTPASSAFAGFSRQADIWRRRAPLPWDIRDLEVVADPVCFLMSDLARGVSGEILHVDAGFHAVGGL